MRILYFLLLIFALMGMGYAQSPTVTGRLTHMGMPLSGIQIWVQGTTLGDISDSQGHFSIKLKQEGDYILMAKPLGYLPLKHPFSLEKGEKLTIPAFDLKEDILGLTEVVITGTMKESSVAQSPVKISVIQSEDLFEAIAPTNLVDGLKMINGVQEVVACGVCFTNSISVNGLPGQYTAVLMDGSPIYGNLAATYGLNGIPAAIIDRIEVVKGPNSTLYGSEAVAGVLNIITKDPEEQPLLNLDLRASDDREYVANASLAVKGKAANGLIGVNYAHTDFFQDEIADGFGDIINLDRLSLFTKWDFKRASKKRFSIAGKFYYEDRRNGVEEYLQNRAYRDLRGNDSIYGESIFTRRGELFGTYEFASSEDLRIDYSFSTHYQNSYYGSDFYEASQHIAFANFIWDKQVEDHSLLFGLTTRYDFYDDNTIATQIEEGVNNPQSNFIPGLFAQDEWRLQEGFTLLAGIRLDHQPDHGLIPSPRLALKVKPGDFTTFRLNGGTGFKTVNLFTEDHAFVSGQREVVIEEQLQPERSYNLSINGNHLYLWGEGQGMIDADVYYTYFTNKIIPDYDTPGQIIYANTEGHAVTRGINLSIQHQIGSKWKVQLAGNVQEVFEVEEEERRDIEFAPSWSGLFNLTHTWEKANLVASYTLNLTGSMALPEVFDLDENGVPLESPRPTRSEAFAIHNFQLTKSFPNANVQVYAGGQNLLNYRQPLSPLVGFNDPNSPAGFSDFFDTAYAYSPLAGRVLYVGARWSL
ncbi:MAG: TonB-dependent receptor [Bacteroidota bacterium]